MDSITEKNNSATHPIAQLFGKIVKRYDLANRLLSFGVDRYWRWRIARLLSKAKPTQILDLATGSGDVAFCLRKQFGPSVEIIGLDFCKPMLETAKAKQANWPAAEKIKFLEGDCLKAPFADEFFDGLTVAFGVRNFDSRTRGFLEMYRLLKPGGRLVILEASQPYGFFKPIYFFYLRHIMPKVAQWITGDIGAYQYLCSSIEAFPSAPALANELEAIGFSPVKTYRPTLGIVAIHVADKP